ncbi:hypothetical protein Snoj_63640 [Streptomyces nojiriensis]|uniref:Chaplin domain-containing protein n=1 Tax=Streptomyces nojiriensis TaxID=66374 RepID=A0ABQ3SWC4_9ACTN|nr:chaplin family protein [Streptomyces nojiriensis]QTI45971.1 hypothetical protein JYK04_03781 [Streptomyces nojiriensis]GGR89064.1 hypothetical protein GCM10010205_16930 [Streptomyces nojiriensis]GHI72446.1 hypothetical protein Snoj_63640 [Streptomyces nojiriensis]
MKTGGSPGALSGNPLQAPVGVPVHACGPAANAAAPPKPASGTTRMGARPSTVLPETPASE